jgi:orotate phosphoribosyltransferase
MQRKEAKNYGTKKLIEGVYEQNGRTLIIEDVVTTGASILETAKVRTYSSNLNNLPYLDPP